MIDVSTIREVGSEIRTDPNLPTIDEKSPNGSFRMALASLVCGPLPPVIAARLKNRIYPFERARLDARPFARRARTGSRFEGTTGDMHAHQFSIHGYFDWRILAIGLASCREGDTVVEVGANVGTETVGLSDLVGPSGEVLAFEPVPANLRWLRRAVELNQPSNITVIPAAVSDRAGRVRFEAPVDDGYSGIGYLAVDGSASSSAIEVEAVTLDGFLAPRGPIRMICVDAEGAEVAIIRGSSETLSKHRPIVIVEASAAHLGRAGHRLAGLKEELESRGYAVHQVGKIGLIPPDLCGAGVAVNWVAVHRSMTETTHAIQRSLVRCGLSPCVRGLNPLVRRPRVLKAPDPPPFRPDLQKEPDEMSRPAPAHPRVAGGPGIGCTSEGATVNSRSRRTP